MALGGIEHIGYLLVSCAILIAGIFLIKKISPFWQEVIFMLLALMGAFGIFFRYAMHLSFDRGFDFITLLKQQLQVCNFNFILLPAAVFTKNKRIKNYLFGFALFAASTTLITYNRSLTQLPWYHISFINFWMNHFIAVLLPTLMLASGRYYPEKKYVMSVSIMVLLYFTLSGFGSWLLMTYEGVSRMDTYSFVFVPEGVWIFEWLYSWIPIYFVYLLPIYPVLVLWLYGFAHVFENKKHHIIEKHHT